MTNQTGFGLALIKEEGGSYIWDETLGSYRKMTAEETAVHNERQKAEDAYARSFPGRLQRFFYRLGRAWKDLWRENDGA